MKKIIIAIDGYSSTGKSTFAKLIAEELGYKYIDTGAMFRAVTLYALQHGMIEDGSLLKENLIDHLHLISLDFLTGKEGLNDILLNGVNIESEIRGLDVSSFVSLVSGVGEVRHKLLLLQREMGEQKGIVMDGRDIGTTIFPEAELKIFMTASPDIRALRRYDEFKSKGMEVAFDIVRNNICERDRMDETREESPLRCADDALVLDNGEMSVEEQMNWVRGVLAVRLTNQK